MRAKWILILLFGAIALLCSVSSAIALPGGVPHADSPSVRSQDWTQTSAADFATGDAENITVTEVDGGELRLSPGAATGVYTSTVVPARFAFNAIVPHWRADLPQGGTSTSLLRVELRVWTPGGGWSRWFSFPAELVPPHTDLRQGGAGVAERQATRVAPAPALLERFYPEAPLLLSGGQQFQCRIFMSLSTALSPSANRDNVASPVLHDITVTYIDASAGPTTSQAKASTSLRMIAAGVAEAGVPQPAIISRAGWGADENWRYDQDGDLIWPLEYVPVSKIIVHHTVTPSDYAEDEAAQWVRAIYYYHAVTREWGDIGYNYLVDRYGNIYEGRYGGPGVVGGHVYGYNRGSVGMAMIGTHGNGADSVPPASRALASLADLSAWQAGGSSSGGTSSGGTSSGRSYVHPLEDAPFEDTVTPNLAGHRDYPPYTTSCPGDLLYAELPALRRAVWDRIISYTHPYSVDWLNWPDLPPALLAGETYSLTMRVRNTGWFTWTQAGPSGVDKLTVHLGYHWLDSDGQPVAQPPEDDHRGSLAHDVTFSHAYTFDPALVTTPITPGTYALAWDMVHSDDGGDRSWFHDANPASPLLTMTVRVFNSPPVSITGRVLDVYGHPVYGVQVAALGANYPQQVGDSGVITVSTDVSGAYALPWLERDVYTLTVSLATEAGRSPPGYAPLLPAYNVDATQGDVTYTFALVPIDLADAIVNGGFESGLDGWMVEGGEGGGERLPQVVSRAHTGIGAAQLGGDVVSGTGGSMVACISQGVRLPAGVLSPTLSFFYDVPVTVSTTNSAAGAVFQAVIVDKLTEVVTYTLPLTVTGWTHFRTDLPPGMWGDRDVRFRLVQGEGLAPIVVLDEVRLCYQPFKVYLPLAPVENQK